RLAGVVQHPGDSAGARSDGDHAPALRRPRARLDLRRMPRHHRSVRVRVRALRRYGRVSRSRSWQGRRQRRRRLRGARFRWSLRRRQRACGGARRQRARARVLRAVHVPSGRGHGRRRRHAGRGRVHQRLARGAGRRARQHRRDADRLRERARFRLAGRAMTRIGRRRFLRGLGAGAAALPLVRLVASSRASEAGLPPPLRFIGVYHPHGIAAELFARREGETETSFALDYPDSQLQPFDDAATYGRSFKDNIIVVEGVDVLSDTNAHNSAGTILTGSRIVGGDGGLPWNSSLDQFLAVENRLGDVTLVPSIALAVGSKQLSARETLSFAQGGVPVSKIIDPAVAFDFLFRRAVVGADPAAQARAERAQRLGKSLIDFARGDIQRLRARVGPFEVQKLDQHLAALRALEKKRDVLSLPSGCTLPVRPAAFPRLERHNGGEPYFDAITDLHIDLLALAMGCDITRFG